MGAHDMKTVHVERNETAARIVQGFLQSNGIDARIVEDDAGEQIPALEAIRGVQVVVPEGDAERARRLLAEREAAPENDGDG